MITEAHQKESLGVAYVQAIAAKAGLNLTNIKMHDYGVDGTFHQVQKIGGRITESGFSLEFQLKSSINWKIEDDFLLYDLEVDNYNDIIRRLKTLYANPLILLLFCLPKDNDYWISCSQEELILRHCCYWHQMNGSLSENTSSVRIKIPISQKLWPKNLHELMLKIQQGERLLC